MTGDLHIHTTYSDGSTPADRIAFLAAAAGLGYAAISDHDSLLGARYAMAHPIQNGVRLIPAVELTAYDAEHEHRVHFLCYWPDDCPALQDYCQMMAERRNAAARRSCCELEAICPQFRTEDALAYAADAGVMYKGHIMRALMDAGLADNIYGDLYHELFSLRPVRGKVLHPTRYQPVEEILALIRQCRGVAVLAHPSVYHSMPLARQLIAQGSIDGVEIEHPRNTSEDKVELYHLAQQYDLIVTGGTDFHGMNSKHPYPIGFCRTDGNMIHRISALASRRKQM